MSYEDYSLATSVFYLPIQSCVTNLCISFSSFDESVSLIKYIVYEYKGNYGSVSTNIAISAMSETITLLTKTFDQKINIILEPDDDLQLSNYTINLSVVRLDTTVNKIVLKGYILKCGINDIYSDVHMLDSQLLDKTSNLVLIMEDKKAKQVYLNSLDTTILNVHLTGGDMVRLYNKETASIEEEVIISLADLLNDEAGEEQEYKVPPIIPYSPPNINPIRPS